MLSSLRIKLLLGASSPAPASRDIMLSLASIRIEQGDEGPILFNMTFEAPPSSKQDMYNPIASDPSLQPFSRAIVMATLNGGSSAVLVDGFITHQQHAPGDGRRPAMFTVTGEDVSVMMSLNTQVVEHVSLDLGGIARKILGPYSRYGLTANVVPPSVQDPPTPEEQTRLQTINDRAYLVQIAAEAGYVFYVTPGPTAGRSTAYWGPRVTDGTVQSALSVDLGPTTNVDSLEMQYKPLDPYLVKSQVLDIDGQQAQVVDVTTTQSSQRALSAKPAISALGANVRSGPVSHAGASVTRSKMLAQARTDDTAAEAVVATGKLSVLRYGAILQSRKLVGVRGAGKSYDGTYRVKSVVHEIGRGKFDQSFTLTREGLDAQSTKVTP